MIRYGPCISMVWCGMVSVMCADVMPRFSGTRLEMAVGPRDRRVGPETSKSGRNRDFIGIIVRNVKSRNFEVFGRNRGFGPKSGFWPEMSFFWSDFRVLARG